MVADEDWTIIVRIVPIRTQSSIESTEPSSKRERKLRISGFLEISGIESCRNSSPRKRIPKPRNISDTSIRRDLSENISGRATATATSDRTVMSILKPSRATIQPVTVVPMLAPRITPMAWVRFISEALTNETTMTVAAEDDWIIIVTIMPVSTAISLLPVMRWRILFIFDPAHFCRPSDRSFIP